ncbi:DUF4231 domain-containing protein [Vibrio parahaemolyticus]|nr:DUF4231 domain-containing protein [Vibrio parahaemolyticus]
MINDPMKLANDYIQHFAQKAKHNKRESLLMFKVVMLSTLLAPLFVSFGADTVTSKIIPSSLSLLAAMATAWLQLRKPQNLWFTYRSAERKIEKELHLYNFKAGQYRDLETPETTLVENILTVVESTHIAWGKDLPKMESFEATSKTPSN